MSKLITSLESSQYHLSFLVFLEVFSLSKFAHALGRAHRAAVAVRTGSANTRGLYTSPKRCNNQREVFRAIIPSTHPLTCKNTRTLDGSWPSSCPRPWWRSAVTPVFPLLVFAHLFWTNSFVLPQSLAVMRSNWIVLFEEWLDLLFDILLCNFNGCTLVLVVHETENSCFSQR